LLERFILAATVAVAWAVGGGNGLLPSPTGGGCACSGAWLEEAAAEAVTLGGDGGWLLLALLLSR